MKRGWAIVLALAGIVPPAAAQTVSGTTFHDRNANGIKDAGEEGLAGVRLHLYGQRDAGGAYDQTVSSSGSGAFSFSPANGCFLLDIEDPPGWRRTLARTDRVLVDTPGYTAPVGLRRFGAGMPLLERMLAGNLRYSSLGDSIAWNWNVCGYTSKFWYSRQVRDRLACAVPSSAITLDEAAVKGEHTDHLLIDDSDLNNVFRVIEAQSDLVTISIIGNDLLNVEPDPNPTPAQINRAVAEVLDARQNLQEILSSLTSEIPQATIELNTLYDNLADKCKTGNSDPFHVEWLPLLNQMLRDLAWGQIRRAANAEVFLEFSHEDLANACAGFTGNICHFLNLDEIHPTNPGYQIIREKVWESLGGANLGPKDALGAASISGADHGYLQRVLRLFPSRFETRQGAVVTTPEAAFSETDGGAGAAVRLGIGAEEFRLTGFPDWYDEVTPVKVIAGIRYRTTGTVTDDFYRVEASINGTFRPPVGHTYSPTNWVFFTPLVGSGGPNMPAENPDYPAVKTLVRPNVPSNREVSATLTKNPVLAPGGSRYDWPAVTRQELGTATVRLAAAPVAGTAGDNFQVVVDAVWLDVYGTTKPRPAEVQNLTVARMTDGSLNMEFSPLAGAEGYNLYFGGLETLLAEGKYDHGNSPLCQVATGPAPGGKLAATVPAAQVPPGIRYILVTGRADGVESPAGYQSGGAERDRSQNTCP